MKRSVGVKWGNLRTGLLLTFAIFIALWASFTGGGTSIFEPKDHFFAYFKNVNGLVAGAPVWMAGVEVGNVRSVKFVNLDTLRQVEIVCRVKESAWHMLTPNSRVQLGTIGFLGDKYIEVLPGALGLEPITSGDTIQTQDAGDAGAMFKAGEAAMKEAGSVVNGLDTLLARMNRGEGTLGKIATDQKLYTDMAELMAELTVLVKDLQKNQERLIGSIEKTSNVVGNIGEKVDQNTGTLGRIVSDPQLYDNLASTTARLDTIMLKIDQAEGSLGLFVNDTAFYSETTNLMKRMNNLISDIQANPRKYFKFSVF